MEEPDGRPRIESAYFEEMHCKNACGDSSGDASVRSGPRRREAESESRAESRAKESKGRRETTIDARSHYYMGSTRDAADRACARLFALAPQP